MSGPAGIALAGRRAVRRCGRSDGSRRLAEVSAYVVVIGDNLFSREDPPACLSAHLDDASACGTPRDDAIRPDRIAAEVGATREHGVAFVGTTGWFGTDATCPPIVGNILVLRDETHVTAPMAMFLQPLLAAAVEPTL